MIGTFFLECPFPPLVEIREHPEFHDLVEMDKLSWPSCLLWHGWLPLLSGVNGGSPWGESPRESASHLLECALGRYSSDMLMGWQLPVGSDAEGAAGSVAAEPDVWTDGSLVEDKVSGASSAGAGCFTYRCSRLWADRRWGHLDEDVGEDSVVTACRGFCSVPRPLQSVQRAEFWCVSLALQPNDGIHLGVDSLGVFRHVGRLLDGRAASRLVELVLIESMLQLWGLDTVRISKVKGHADEASVRAGRARDLIRLGNNRACEAADFGRRRVPWWIIDARRNYSGVCARWRRVVLGPLPGLLVNHDGLAGTSLDPMVWSVGGAPKRRRVVHAIRDRAFLPGPAGIWDGEWGRGCCDSNHLP